MATRSGTPVVGARVESFIANATADADGRFTLAAPTAPPANLAITVLADGIRTRETVIALPRSNEALVDVMSTAPPFDERFYNQLVRDAFETPDAVYPSFRWASQMRFYIRTLDENLRVASPETLGTVRQAIVDAVRAYSGGLYDAIIEEGTESRPERVGWINVDLLQTIPEGDYCGYVTSVGGNPTTIKLRLDRCGCGSVKIPPDLVIHEVGHSMGLFHVEGKGDVMSTTISGKCTPILPSAREQHHAALMYSRPRSNRDPDRDPAGFTLAVPDGPSPGAKGRP